MLHCFDLPMNQRDAQERLALSLLLNRGITVRYCKVFYAGVPSDIPWKGMKDGGRKQDPIQLPAILLGIQPLRQPVAFESQRVEC
jgi:hypothetical protein